MTKNMVKSTGNVVKDVSFHKKKPSKLESAVSELSLDAEEVSADEEVSEEDAATVEQKGNDDSTDMASKGTRTKKVKQDDKSTVFMIYMAPALSFLLHDATIAIGSALLIAAYPTIANFDLILENQIPASVTITWILVAFAVGYEVALLRFMPATAVIEEDIVYEDLTIPSEIDVPIMAAPPKQGYSVLRRMSMKFPGIKIHIPQQVKPRNVWSTLTTKRGEQSRWQRRARGNVSAPLMKRLLRNPSYQRSCVEAPVEAVVAPTKSIATEGTCKDTKMGGYQLSNAESLVEDVIEPQFVLRGMDVFMTEDLEGGAEDNISLHPFLIE